MVRRRERKQTTVQITIVPTRYHKEKDQEARLMAPVATPNGIPIIKPNPTIKEGAIAMSGLLAREKRTMNSSNPKKTRGLIRKQVISNGTGRTKFPVTGLMVIKFIARRTISVETAEMANPGRKIAKLLLIQISLGLSGVAKRDAMFPLTFSLTMGRLAKAQMKVIRINSGKK
ncbi:MAG: hypothetical protein H8E13_07215 [Actinobacteria bacterium]|nr:hypothetical protein [Actinomycetota bacterium]